MKPVSFITVILSGMFAFGPSVFAGGGLQQRIDEAAARGDARVALPPGDYRIDHAIRLRGLSNFTLDGTGAKLVFTDLDDGGILATGCAGLTLRGFTVDFDPLPFTQGTVEKVNAERSEVTFVLHDGYPNLAPHFLTGRAHLFSPKTLDWKRSAPDIYANEARALSPRRGVLRFSPERRDAFSAFAAGDFVVLDYRHARGVRIENCRDVRIEGVTFWSAPSIAVVARYMDGKNIFSYKIQRGPLPPGASVPRLLSTSADGLNYAYARTGPIIENCDFSYMGDDSVNLHGIAFLVAKTEGNVVWLLRPYVGEAFTSVIEPGDDVHGLAAGSFDIKGRAKVAHFGVEPAPSKDFSALAARTWKSAAVKAGRLTVYRLDLSKPLALGVGDFVEIPAIAAPGYVIRNNRFAHHRGRALRLMSPQGLVEGNVIEDVKQVAISLGAEFTFVREAGWLSDVVVRKNTIRRVGFDPALQRPSSYAPGAISVFYRGETPDSPRAETRYEHLCIEDNVIEDTGGPAISINQAHDVRITGNRLLRNNQISRPGAGSLYGLTTDKAVCVDHSTDVVIEPETKKP